MRNQRLKGRSLHGHVSDAAATRPKYSQRPSSVNQTSGAGIINTFLASICPLDRSSLDDVQSEIVTAILRFAVCMIGGEAFSVEDKKTGGRLGYYRTQAEAEKARDAFSRLYKNEIEMAKRSSG